MSRGFYYPTMGRGRDFHRAGREEYRSRRDEDTHSVRSQATSRPRTPAPASSTQNVPAEEVRNELHLPTENNSLPPAQPVRNLYAEWCSWLEELNKQGESLGGIYSSGDDAESTHENEYPVHENSEPTRDHNSTATAAPRTDTEQRDTDQVSQVEGSVASTMPIVDDLESTVRNDTPPGPSIVRQPEHLTRRSVDSEINEFADVEPISEFGRILEEAFMSLRAFRAAYRDPNLPDRRRRPDIRDVTARVEERMRDYLNTTREKRQSQERPTEEQNTPKHSFDAEAGIQMIEEIIESTRPSMKSSYLPHPGCGSLSPCIRSSAAPRPVKTVDPKLASIGKQGFNSLLEIGEKEPPLPGNRTFQVFAASDTVASGQGNTSRQAGTSGNGGSSAITGQSTTSHGITTVHGGGTSTQLTRSGQQNPAGQGSSHQTTVSNTLGTSNQLGVPGQSSTSAVSPRVSTGALSGQTETPISPANSQTTRVEGAAPPRRETQTATESRDVLDIGQENLENLERGIAGTGDEQEEQDRARENARVEDPEQQRTDVPRPPGRVRRFIRKIWREFRKPSNDRV